jgi:DNA-binding response OmpR family regulator
MGAAATVPKRAVVAEDDLEFCRLLGFALERDGFDVTALHDGTSLLGLVEEVAVGRAPAPDVIVADIQLPGCTGLAVLGAMARLGLAVPTVLITAFGAAGTRALAARLGAAAFLDKPFTLSELSRIIRLVLS